MTLQDKVFARTIRKIVAVIRDRGLSHGDRSDRLEAMRREAFDELDAIAEGMPSNGGEEKQLHVIEAVDVALDGLEPKHGRAMSAKVDRPYLAYQQDYARTGPIKARNTFEPVMGAFDAEGHRPVLERSRKER